MNVKFEKKPSKEIIEKFCKKIEKFLSSQELRIRVELLDTPMPLESYVNGKHTNTTYLWIDKCLINTPKTKKEIEVRLFGDGVDDTTSDEQIWNEAGYIQDQLYTYLGIDPGNPKEGDPYWNLWEHAPKNR